MKNSLSYIAGYIDGDGCFYIGKQSNPIKYRASIIISSTNKNVLENFKVIFGGIVYLTPKRFDHWKRTYHWIIRGKIALDFSYKVIDFLKEKKGDAHIFIGYSNQSSKPIKQEYINCMIKHRDDVRKIDESVIQELRNIKPTGFKNPLDFPYLAGFIDAECCLGISKYKPKNRPNFTYKISLQCNNANPIIFYWLMDKLGGSISHVKRSQKNPKHRDQITWVVTGTRLANILPKIYPYLISKKPVCQKLIEFHNTILPNGGDRHSKEFQDSYNEILQTREKIVDEIHKLNSKGVNNV